jgi:2-alkenal reductase
LIAGLALSGLACSISVFGQQVAAPDIAAQPTVTAASAPIILDSSDEVLVSLYERVNPSVVNITVYTEMSGGVIPGGQGSGFVFDNQGHIVTNAHVVHGSEAVEVVFSNGIIRQASVIGEDLNSDLAVLEVVDFPTNIPALPMGTMADLRVGQSVVAIGNPWGLSGSLTRGIISSLGRTIPALNSFSIPQSIQTDAAINPGNSGGPLLDLSGRVIGVNAQIETDNGVRANAGVGFAIPVSIIERVVPELIAQGEYVWPWIGVRGSELNYALIKGMDLPVEQGAYIWEVIENGPAEKAGLVGASEQAEVDGRLTTLGGDVVIAVDGQSVSSFDDLMVYVALNKRPGDTITLTVLRGGEQIEVQIELEARPSSTF